MKLALQIRTMQRKNTSATDSSNWTSCVCVYADFIVLLVSLEAKCENHIFSAYTNWTRKRQDRLKNVRECRMTWRKTGANPSCVKLDSGIEIYSRILIKHIFCCCILPLFCYFYCIWEYLLHIIALAHRRVASLLCIVVRHHSFVSFLSCFFPQ